ncbi:MAG: hypothetical protein R8G33_01135 [Gammaproteobacteria bacterium]|nr:hypothetical protein [Gammaproteobacteria bacterium]
MEGLKSIFKNSFRHGKCSITWIYNKKSHSPSNTEKHLSANRVAFNKALKQCRKEIKKSRRWKIMPSPICFEHAAMLSRQTKNYQKEIKICQLYISCIDEHLSKRSFNKKRVEKKAHSLCRPLSARLLSAKKLHKNSGVDVRHLS